MQEPIRVLNLFCVLDRGGAETFVMNVYRNIDRSKVQFDFLVFEGKEGAYESEILSLGGKIYRTPALKIGNIFAYIKYLNAFFKEHKEYTIIHCHMSEIGAIAFMIAKKHRVPVRICHAHSAPQNFGLKLFIRNIFKIWMNEESTDFYACGERAGKWQYGKKPFKIIKNGIDTDKFAYNPQIRREVRTKLGFDGYYIIGHVGRFEYPKNHEYIVKLFALLKREIPLSKLALVGNGSTYQEIVELVNRYKLQDDVIFMGVRNDIDQLVQAFDLFVLPSKYEGFPIALVEAQCAGLHCITSETVSTEADVTGLVKFLPIEEKNIINWVECAKNNISQRDRCGYNHKVKINGYNIADTARYLQDTYIDLFERC